MHWKGGLQAALSAYSELSRLPLYVFANFYPVPICPEDRRLVVGLERAVFKASISSVTLLPERTCQTLQVGMEHREMVRRITATGINKSDNAASSL
jgi:hypothetical protein